MDKKYFIHRVLALLLSIFVSYIPIIMNTKPLNIKDIFENGQIIFSLIALLSICMFEVLEANLENITLVLICFVIWFIIIIVGIIVYMYQNQAPNNSYWQTNLACLIASTIIYLFFYGAIAFKRKRTTNND